MLKDVDPASIKAQLQALGDTAAAQYARELIERLQIQLKFEHTKNAALNFELTRLKQWRFGKSSESLDAQGGNPQTQLFDAKTEQLLVEESKAEDRAEDEARTPGPSRIKRQAKRQALPSQLERIEHHYEIEPALCSAGHPLKRIGQDISEQLDCVPAQFFVHRHIRGKYACVCCNTVLAAPMPAQIIDKGIPAPGLLAQVIIAKHDDHLPLYRQEEIYRRSGAFIARSSMASWVGQCGVQLQPLAQAIKSHLLSQAVLHADETPIKLLAPGSGKTDTAYAWVIRSSDLEATERAVVYEFCNSRQGQHAATLLEGFQGSLVCDDYSGYKALFKQQPIQEAGCWAHARRKFFEAHKLNQSEIAKEALHRIQQLYDVERQGAQLTLQERHQLRQDTSTTLLQEFKAWLLTQRQQLMNADVTAKAMDYTLKRWAALTLHLADARIPIDNNAVENAIRPLALGRKNWLFVGSQQAGERAAVLMTLIESAKLNGHDAWVYLKDVLTKLPTWPNSRLHELLPHRWVSPETASVAATAPVNT
ncbi:MAG: IS66 family transposase [Rhizobacter sp.]